MITKEARERYYSEQLSNLIEDLDKNTDMLKYLARQKVSLTMNDYQFDAQRTANPADPIRLATAGLGVAGEAGELAGAIKKHLSHGHDLDKEHIKEEIGDVLWYLAEIAAALDMTLEEVAIANIAKLKRRYPDGFDPERSKNREEG